MPYLFLDCSISKIPLTYVKVYPFLDCPISLFTNAAGSAVSLLPFPYLSLATFLAKKHMLCYFGINLDLILSTVKMEDACMFKVSWC